MAVRYLGNEDGLVEIGAPHRYKVGDLVFWATSSAAGEYTFIGYPQGDKTGADLMLAMASVGGEHVFPVDARQCAPTGFTDQRLGLKYRRRYLQRFPGSLEGSTA
jgi:hypothetical protein